MYMYTETHEYISTSTHTCSTHVQNHMNTLVHPIDAYNHMLKFLKDYYCLSVLYLGSYFFVLNYHKELIIIERNAIIAVFLI